MIIPVFMAGTWADLMFIDPSLLADGTNGDEANFAQFVADLRSGSATSIYRYRQRYPCYAQIYLHAGGDCDPATDAGLYRFDRNRPDGRQILGGILPNVNYAE